MKKNRVQPLNQTYHQLSQLLHETLLSLYASGSLPEEGAPLQRAGIVLSLYERHIAKEEAILFGILHDYEPCVTTVLLSNYKMITKQIGNLRKMIILQASQEDNRTKQSNHPLLYLFNEFLNTCTAQMKEHQSLINPVLWRYYSDEELQQMTTAFIISKPLFTYQGKAVA